MSLFHRYFFKHFASKNQLPGFYISGTLVENDLIKLNCIIHEIITWDVNAAFPYFLRFLATGYSEFSQDRDFNKRHFQISQEKHMSCHYLRLRVVQFVLSHFLFLESLVNLPGNFQNVKVGIININSTYKFKCRKCHKKILYKLWKDVPYQKSEIWGEIWKWSLSTTAVSPQCLIKSQRYRVGLAVPPKIIALLSICKKSAQFINSYLK